MHRILYLLPAFLLSCTAKKTPSEADLLENVGEAAKLATGLAPDEIQCPSLQASEGEYSCTLRFGSSKVVTKLILEGENLRIDAPNAVLRGKLEKMLSDQLGSLKIPAEVAIRCPDARIYDLPVGGSAPCEASFANKKVRFQVHRTDADTLQPLGLVATGFVQEKIQARLRAVLDDPAAVVQCQGDPVYPEEVVQGPACVAHYKGEDYSFQLATSKTGGWDMKGLLVRPSAEQTLGEIFHQRFGEKLAVRCPEVTPLFPVKAGQQLSCQVSRGNQSLVFAASIKEDEATLFVANDALEDIEKLLQ